MSAGEVLARRRHRAWVWGGGGAAEAQSVRWLAGPSIDVCLSDRPPTALSRYLDAAATHDAYQMTPHIGLITT